MDSISQKQNNIGHKGTAVPTLNSMLTTNSLVFFFFNVLLLGIYGAADTLSKRFKVKELKIRQNNIQEQINKLLDQWSSLEKNLTDILSNLNANSTNKAATDQEVKNLNDTLNLINNKKVELSKITIQSDLKLPPNLSTAALKTITFVIEWIKNIGSLGICGIYQHNILENKIKILKEKNELIQAEFDKQKKIKENVTENTIKVVNSYICSKKDLSDIENTAPAVAHRTVEQIKSQMQALQKKHDDLTVDYTALKTQKTALDQSNLANVLKLQNANNEIDNLRKTRDDLEKAQKTSQQEKDQLNNAILQKNLEVQNLQQQMKQSQQAKDLQKQVDNLKALSDPEMAENIAKIGPIPKRYKQRFDKNGQEIDGELIGAKDIQSNDNNNNQTISRLTDPNFVKFANEYNARYQNLTTAGQVVKVGYRYAYEKLIDMAATGDKIKLNNSGFTLGTNGVAAIYHYMILDLIKGAKLKKDSCHAYHLFINKNVSMAPSNSQYVLGTKFDNGSLQDKQYLYFKYITHDDFTPVEEVLGLPEGVDAVSVRWILHQLTKDEENHLFNLLMRPVVENNHPDYLKTQQYIQNSANPRVKLVLTARDLIEHMGKAMFKKFNHEEVKLVWAELEKDKKLDDDKMPFEKEEDKKVPNKQAEELEKIADTQISTSKKDKEVKWEYDRDVFANVISGYKQYYQETFADKVLIPSLKTYQNVFNQIYENKLSFQTQIPKGTELTKLGFEEINKLFFISHEMIGQNSSGQGGLRCMFSNLLAVLMCDKSALTNENGEKLKVAMAAYLEKLFQAKLNLKYDQNNKLLKELSDLYDNFEKSIFNDYQCSVEEYQKWLRGQPCKGKMNINSLSTFEIELCAFTLGIKIGVIPIWTESEPIMASYVVDEYGRIVPKVGFLGPNTKEFFLLGCARGKSNDGTFHGLFQKIKEPTLKNSDDEFSNASCIHNYWKQLNMNDKSLPF